MNTDDYLREEAVPGWVWISIEWVCTAVFTVELVIRFLFCDAKGGTRVGFVTAPLNICDALAIMPFYLKLMVGSDIPMFRVLRVVRLTRVVRFFKAARNSPQMRIMVEG